MLKVFASALAAMENAFERWKATIAGVGIQPDGTVYVGRSPTDGRPLYAMRHDLEGLHTWDGAKRAAATQAFGGHIDWRLPTECELTKLYRFRHAIGGFANGWYWSATSAIHFGAHRTFKYDSPYQIKRLFKYDNLRVRFVRSG